jgi:glycosyltransferase involved in cell wall biosynthesis
VDLARFRPAAARTGSGPLQLIFVGRLRYYKGLDTLLRAVALVPGIRADIVGSGPMQAEMEALAVQLEVADRVTFAGDVSDADLPERYRSADVFVLPANARAEAFGTVLIEAMASGLPCITTELGTGTSWIVQDGVTGRVVRPMDPPALAEAIQELSDPVRRREMGVAGRRRAEEHFTRQRMIDQVVQVYREALG